jgi:hypothetical protein
VIKKGQHWQRVPPTAVLELGNWQSTEFSFNYSLDFGILNQIMHFWMQWRWVTDVNQQFHVATVCILFQRIIGKVRNFLADIIQCTERVSATALKSYTIWTCVIQERTPYFANGVRTILHNLLRFVSMRRVLISVAAGGKFNEWARRRCPAQYQEAIAQKSFIRLGTSILDLKFALFAQADVCVCVCLRTNNVCSQYVISRNAKSDQYIAISIIKCVCKYVGPWRRFCVSIQQQKHALIPFSLIVNY